MSIQHMPYNLTDAQIVELWDRYGQAETVSALARRFGKTSGSMSARVQATGGIRPAIPTRAARHLSLEEREEISRGLATVVAVVRVPRMSTDIEFSLIWAMRSPSRWHPVAI